MKVLGVLGLVVGVSAFSGVIKNSAEDKAKVEARRQAANGSCANVKLRCGRKRTTTNRGPNSSSTGCHCHGVYKNRNGVQTYVKCIVQDESVVAAGTVFKSGETGMCREKKPPCEKREPRDLFGTCGEAWEHETCFMDCDGPACVPNYNGKGCLRRPDVCKSFKNGNDRCNKYKNYTEASYMKDACCRRCYRKTRDRACLLGYIPTKTKKKNGPQGVKTWLDEFSHMANAKTKLCCRIKGNTYAAMVANGFESVIDNPVFGPTPGGRLDLSLCYGVQCGDNGSCNPEDGSCMCDIYYTSSSPDSPCDTYDKPDAGNPCDNVVTCDAIDTVFLIDGSGSVGPTNFETTRQFVKLVMRNTRMKTAVSRFAAVQYSSGQVIEFTFNTDQDISVLNALMNNMPYRGGGTMTGAGMQRARTVLDMASGTTQRMIVITDGSSGDNNVIISESASMAAAGIELYCIGIGSGIPQSGLTIVTNGDASKTMLISQWSAVNDLLNLGSTDPCQETETEQNSALYQFLTAAACGTI